MGRPSRLAGFFALVVAAVALAGCSADEQADAARWEACTGARTRFFAQAPGLHERLASLPPDHPMLAVAERPAGEGWLTPLEADGLAFPKAWEGAKLASVSWDVGPPITIPGEAGRFPDSSQGFLSLAPADGKAVVGGDLPEEWPASRRDAALDAFLANVTALDTASRQPLVAGARWITNPVADSLPSTLAAGQTPAAASSMGSGTSGFLTLAAIPLPGRPSLAPALGDATRWREVIPGDGYRQALVDGYEVNVQLPTRVAVWDLPAATVETNVDAEDWTRVWVLSKQHDVRTAWDLHNASLEGAGWHGEAAWRAFHEGYAPFEPGQAACPSTS